WWEKGDFVAVLKFVIARLVIDADGGQHRFAHGAEFWKAPTQIVQEFAKSLPRANRLRELGAAGQLFEVRVKLDLYVHGFRADSIFTTAGRQLRVKARM